MKQVIVSAASLNTDYSWAYTDAFAILIKQNAFDFVPVTFGVGIQLVIFGCGACLKNTRWWMLLWGWRMCGRSLDEIWLTLLYRGRDISLFDLIDSPSPEHSQQSKSNVFGAFRSSRLIVHYMKLICQLSPVHHSCSSSALLSFV